MLRRARKYNKKIDLYQTTQDYDGFGGYTNTEALIGSYWVYITTLTGASRFNLNSDSLGTIDLANSVKLIFRHNPNVTFDYKDMYFQYRGFRYTIQNNSININFENREVELFATRENYLNPTVPDTTPPTIPQNVIVGSITASTALVQWDASTDVGGNPILYDVYLDGVIVATTSVAYFTLINLLASTSYEVTITAKDRFNNTSDPSTPVTFLTTDTEAPTVPTDVVVSNITETTADLNWTASTDNSGGVITYEIFANGISQGTTTLTSFNLTGLSSGTSYSITITASDESGNTSAPSTPVVFETESLFDADYQAVLDYNTAEGNSLPSEPQQILQNQLVLDLKTAGVWTKLGAFGVLATDGDGNYALTDWKRLITMNAINSPTFIPNAGYQGNLTSAYIDILGSPDSILNYNISDASLGAYYSNVLTRTDDKIGFGIRQSSNNKSTGVTPFDSSRALHTVNDDLGFSVQSYTRANGYFLATRDNSANYNFYLNGGLVGNYAKSEDIISLATENFYLLAFNAGGSTPSGFSDDIIPAFHIGANLTSTEVADMTTSIDTYLNAI